MLKILFAKMSFFHKNATHKIIQMHLFFNRAINGGFLITVLALSDAWVLLQLAFGLQITCLTKSLKYQVLYWEISLIFVNIKIDLWVTWFMLFCVTKNACAMVLRHSNRPRISEKPPPGDNPRYFCRLGKPNMLRHLFRMES